MINRILRLTAGVLLTGALVILGMAWGRYVSPATSVDSRQALTAIVIAGVLITYPAIGIFHWKPRT